MEKRLVLVHLPPGSGTDACVSSVHVDCTTAGTPHCHVFLIPHQALPIPMNSAAGMTRSESVGRARRHVVASDASTPLGSCSEP